MESPHKPQKPTCVCVCVCVTNDDSIKNITKDEVGL